jgi:hypothetical protein
MVESMTPEARKALEVMQSTKLLSEQEEKERIKQEQEMRKNYEFGMKDKEIVDYTKKRLLEDEKMGLQSSVGSLIKGKSIDYDPTDEVNIAVQMGAIYEAQKQIAEDKKREQKAQSELARLTEEQAEESRKLRNDRRNKSWQSGVGLIGNAAKIFMNSLDFSQPQQQKFGKSTSTAGFAQVGSVEDYSARVQWQMKTQTTADRQLDETKRAARATEGVKASIDALIAGGLNLLEAKF